VGRSPGITGLVASIVTLLAMGVAVAQDATWKDCELAARDPDRSIAACSKLLKRPTSQAHAAAFHHRGLAYAAKGNLDQAISDISAGIRVDPQPAYRWQERGELYARQGKYQQAVADITEAIRRDPTPRAFRFHSRAQAYQSLGDLTRAIADFDEAIRLDPEARSFRFHARANALRDAGQYDRALADYETALKLAPTNAWVLVDRGRTYARMGRFEAAKTDFDYALRLDPANEQKLRPVIEMEVAALPGQSPPSTAQETPPQSPQQPAPAQRPEDAALPGQSPPSTAQKTPPQSPQQPAPARFRGLPPKFHGEWCQVNDLDASQRLLKPCKEVPECKDVPACKNPPECKDVRAGGCYRIQLDAKSLTLKFPLQVACTATDSLPDYFEGDIETWTVRYSCAGAIRQSIFKFSRMSQDASARQGTYLTMESLGEEAYALARKTLAEFAMGQSLGVYYHYYKPDGTRGDGCGGFGVAIIDEIEKVAAKMNGSDPNTLATFKSRLRMQLLDTKYGTRFRVEPDPEPARQRAFFVPNLDKLDEKTMRECLPNYSKLIDNFLPTKWRALENMRRPVNLLYRAYSLYSFIQLCNQVREGYLATSINDVELQRARTASKAIEKELIAKDPTIDPDKTFAEADQSARSVLSRFKGRETSEAFRRECKSALDELLSASPVSPYETHRP